MIQLSSNAAFASTAAGIVLVYGELCMPGSVLPGCSGAILVLGGGYFLLQKALTPAGVVLLGFGLVLLIYAARRPTRSIAFASLFCLSTGSVVLVPPPEQISFWIAVPFSLLIGLLTITLSRLAIFARKRKRTL